LSTYATQSQVIVTVNGVQSQCNGDCSYIVNATITPQLTAATLTGARLNLTITDPASLGFNINQLKVNMDNQICTIVPGGTISLFQCDLPKNSDSTPIIRAGNYLPIV
jgi:hypothetical protein